MRADRHRRERSPSNARRNCSGPSTRTCSRTPARRRTCRSTSPCSSPATPSWEWTSRTADISRTAIRSRTAAVISKSWRITSAREDETIDYDADGAACARRTQAAADHLRCLGVLAHHRFQADPRDLRQVGFADDGRHRPHRRPRRHRPASIAGAVRRLRHDDDAQDAARSARGA